MKSPNLQCYAVFAVTSITDEQNKRSLFLIYTHFLQSEEEQKYYSVLTSSPGDLLTTHLKGEEETGDR